MLAIRWCPSGVPVKLKFLYAGASYSLMICKKLI